MNNSAKVLVVTLFLAVSGCAAQQKTMAPAEPALAERHCDFTAEQVAQIRSRALEFLIAEWPVLDARCEGIANVIRQRPNADCAIPGGPLMKDGCPIPSHRGYIITFDDITLAPKNIYWVPADF